MRRLQAAASSGAGGSRAQRAGKKAAAAADKGRMVHIRLDPDLHRKIRLVVAAEDTTLQEWIARTLEAAAEKAWHSVTKGGSQ